MVTNPYSEPQLNMAYQHVRRGEQHVARQREIVARIQALGYPSADANRLLATFEAILRQHKSHVQDLLRRHVPGEQQEFFRSKTRES